ncbi:DUF3768 domain-containing protein [Devosia submarina]|uniref:DUF3768 domain-containing protein n=1 Tax=Devosia submarina TaxID=1173082 RepID=UPI000D3A43A5|nr:DUF3768 domain-containing protein [Devosia submarina]
MAAVNDNGEAIRSLNDLLRQRGIGGRVVITRGVLAFGPDALRQIQQAVASFDAFTPDNDPYGEHDFGAVGIEDQTLFFKIDAYDRDLRYHSPDPADPAVTRRVMTLMLAEEY